MIDLPLGKLKFNEDVEFSFPGTMCCNCGRKAGLKTVEQDTRRTTYMFAGGTEITFKLPLPFCDDCAPSAQRRPKNAFHRVLAFLVSFGVAALALIVIGDLVLDRPEFAKHIVTIPAIVAAFVTGAWILASRPRSPGTSYYQPVRIPTLKREFVSGVVTAIGFAFTNGEYARAFASANRDAIAKKVVSVEKA